MSFLSVELQSRVVLASHSGSLLAQFDTHLRTIADRYSVFFLSETRRRHIRLLDLLTLLSRFSVAALLYFIWPPRISHSSTPLLTSLEPQGAVKGDHGSSSSTVLTFLFIRLSIWR